MRWQWIEIEKAWHHFHFHFRDQIDFENKTFTITNKDENKTFTITNKEYICSNYFKIVISVITLLSRHKEDYKEKQGV